MTALLTGLLAGALHVWTGPDHLVAIAPLALREPGRSWVPGVRWGLGHSTGVALVGLLSLGLRDLLPVELLSSWGERMVGVVLLAVGLWALRAAFADKIHLHDHEHDGDRHAHVHVHGRPHGERWAHRHTHAALGIGILHGLAGSAHFLGVLPILALPTRTQAALYLVAFASGTVLSMAAFSSILGFVAGRWATKSAMVYRGLMSTAAVAAMGVGGLWIVTTMR